MSPSATLVRAAARPFAAAPASFPSSPLSLLVRRIATGARPAAAAAKSAGVPPFSSASFFAGAAARRAANGGSSSSRYSNFYFGQAGRRFQSSSSSGAAGAADAAAAPHPSWIRRMWDSPIGLKTVHFWAPVMKWALVVAGISDLARPPEKLSVTQNVALTATGLIWTRWCLIIKPKNYLLAAANFFLGIAGLVQCGRIFMARKAIADAEAQPVAAAVEAVKQ